MVVIQSYYTKPTNDNDITYYYDDHNNNCNNKEICVHIMCDKQVLLDYNKNALPVWNTKILSKTSLLKKPLIQHSID